jgi:hypothetical protein
MKIALCEEYSAGKSNFNLCRCDIAVRVGPYISLTGVRVIVPGHTVCDHVMRLSDDEIEGLIVDPA